jgi:beta-glucanase (GH16 family)
LEGCFLNKRIFVELFFLIIIFLSFFIAFKKPAEKKYNINVIKSSESNVLVEDFNNNLDKNYWNIIDNVKNNKLQYNSKNVNVKNSLLEIEAKKENNNEYEYTSGLINTKGKFEFQYGKIIFRAKPASGEKILSAVYLLPADDSLLPEIDIINALGNNQVWTGINYLDSNLKEQQKISNNQIQNEFSIYEMDWNKEGIRVYKDNKLIFETTTNVPDKKMYLKIDLTVDENWTGILDDSNLSSTLLLDYIIIIPEEMSVI